MNRKRIAWVSVALAVILLSAALLYGVLIWFGVVQLGAEQRKIMQSTVSMFLNTKEK